MKNVWKRITIAILVVGLMLLGFSTLKPAGQAALAQDVQPTNRISVTGEGVLKMKADTARITLGVLTEEVTAESAQAKNAEKMNVIKGALGRILTSADEWETVGLSLYPQYDWSEGGNGKLISFRAENTILITLSDPTRAGEVIDGCVKSGANTVSGIEFTLRDTDKVRLEAIKLAMQNAEVKASTALAVAGRAIKDVLEVNVMDSYYNPVPIYKSYDMALSAEGAPAPTPTQPGTLEVQATVSVVYAF
ncbi:MAG: SIMPL domain-containing protein [Coprothermobacterota bacterium]|nr:SIMPL domain-containing protein [Coprothermobacterota bacterium]